MNELARGLILLFFPMVLFRNKIPGDLLANREYATFSFPHATSIVVSLLICRILFVTVKLR